MSDRHDDAPHDDVPHDDEPCLEAGDRRRIAMLAAFALDDEPQPEADEALPFVPHLAELAPVRRR